MPIYEYYCENCGAEFEKIVRLSEKDNAVECPECHSALTNRILSTVASCGSGGTESAYSSCSSGSGFS